MIREICFASNNLHKLEEISRLVPGIRFLTLRNIGCLEELPETQGTIAGNSLQKAEVVMQRYGVECFADDSGLEVQALGGAPGVHSAYFAGPDRDSVKNYNKLLSELKGIDDRRARFITVITFCGRGLTVQFEGVLNGSISNEAKGTGGFGYDPIFIPEGMSRTLAEMSMEEKNSISHRSKAVSKLIDFLNGLKV